MVDAHICPHGVFVLAGVGLVLVGDGGDGAEEHRRHGCTHADQPQGDGHGNRIAAGFLDALLGQRVDHGQIPLEGYDGQQQNTAVKSGVEDEVHNVAEHVCQDPTPDVVDCPEWQSGSE